MHLIRWYTVFAEIYFIRLQLQVFFFLFLDLLSRWQRDLTHQLTWRWLTRQRGAYGSHGSLETSTTAPHRVRKYSKASIFCIQYSIKFWMWFLKCSPFLKFLQSSWSSMRICSTSQGFGPTWQRLPVLPPRPSWACPRMFTTPSESWPWIASATATRANLPTSTEPTLQVNIQKSRKIRQKL